MANNKNCALDPKREYPCLANNSTKKNAASDATDNDAKAYVTHEKQQANTTQKRGGSAMSKYGKDKHKRIAKMLGYVLTLGRVSDWHGFTISLLANLSEKERAALAFSALNSLDHNNAYKIASVALFGVLNGEVAG